MALRGRGRRDRIFSDQPLGSRTRMTSNCRVLQSRLYCDKSGVFRASCVVCAFEYTWSHAGLNRGLFGHWPNVLTN